MRRNFQILGGEEEGRQDKRKKKKKKERREEGRPKQSLHFFLFPHIGQMMSTLRSFKMND